MSMGRCLADVGNLPVQFGQNSINWMERFTAEVAPCLIPKPMFASGKYMIDKVVPKDREFMIGPSFSQKCKIMPRSSVLSYPVVYETLAR
jgi:hypothetical protein